MAQRTIHVLFGTLLSDKIHFSDMNRFLVGSILPDAYINPADRQFSHFIKHIPDKHCHYFDFETFFLRYQNRIMTDDLYLGYYAHLLEDAFYRYFLYYEKCFIKKLKCYKLDILHNDYHILNSYIANKYILPNHLEIPYAFENELINELTTFDINTIINNYKNDIVESCNQKTIMLTESMIDEFILKYTDTLIEALHNAKNGKLKLNVRDYCWKVI